MPLFELCRSWPPPTSTPARSSLPFPDVPVLALAGREDLRTPLADAGRALALFPRGQLLIVPNVGHSVLGADLSDCTRRAVVEFIAARPVAPCTGGRRVFGVLPKAPAPGDLKPVGGVKGLPGRTLAALSRTLDDATTWGLLAGFDSSGAGGARTGGLRAGYLLSRGDSLTLTRYSYVPGVIVSGRLTEKTNRFTISGPGAASGTITLDDDRVKGTLGGVAIDRPLSVLR
jgi:hypothetical protein